MCILGWKILCMFKLNIRNLPRDRREDKFILKEKVWKFLWQPGSSDLHGFKVLGNTCYLVFCDYQKKKKKKSIQSIFTTILVFSSTPSIFELNVINHFFPLVGFAWYCGWLSVFTSEWHKTKVCYNFNCTLDFSVSGWFFQPPMASEWKGLVFIEDQRLAATKAFDVSSLV